MKWLFLFLFLFFVLLIATGVSVLLEEELISAKVQKCYNLEQNNDAHSIIMYLVESSSFLYITIIYQSSTIILKMIVSFTYLISFIWFMHLFFISIHHPCNYILIFSSSLPIFFLILFLAESTADYCAHIPTTTLITILYYQYVTYTYGLNLYLGIIRLTSFKTLPQLGSKLFSLVYV